MPASLRSDAEARRKVDNLYEHRLNDNSSDKYKGPWRRFTKWLDSIGISKYLDVSIVTDQVIVFYLGHIVEDAKNRSVGKQVINTTLAAIRYFYLSAGLESPTESPIVTSLRLAVPRILIGKRSSCVPLTAEQLLTVLQFHLTSSCTLRVRMHLTIYLLMFVGLFRFSDVQKILVHDELLQKRYDKQGNLIGLLIFIPWSKTDQSHDGAWVAIGATRGAYCPVGLVLSLLRKGKYATRPSSTEFVGPLLRATARHNPDALKQTSSSLDNPIQPLTYQAMLHSIQPMVKEAIGVHTALHGPRKGGASTAAQEGIESQLICSLGRWKFGNTFEDTYLTMLDGNARKYFDLTRKIWPY